MSLAYAIAEKVMIAWFESAFPAVTPCTETDDKLGDSLPVVKVNRIGNSLSGLTTDGARIDLEVFHSTVLAALTLGSQIRAALIADAPGFAHGGALISQVVCGGPIVTPYGNTAIRRVELHPSITFHNQ